MTPERIAELERDGKFPLLDAMSTVTSPVPVPTPAPVPAPVPTPAPTPVPVPAPFIVSTYVTTLDVLSDGTLDIETVRTK